VLDLKGKVAIVTGSATGIGRSIALALADHGCNIVINYTRSEDEARETLGEVERRGVEALLAQADVSVDDDCRRVVAAALERWQRVDVLVNNAGITTFVPFEKLDDLTEDVWDRIFAVNVKGAFLMARAAATALKTSGNGAIVNVSSIAGIHASGSSIPYAASKAALHNLTTSLARVLGPEVRVNAVAPGFVETRWLERGYGERLHAIRKLVKQKTPLGTTAGPEHVARAVVALVTGMDFVTGQIIAVDGGFLVGR